MTKVIGPRDYEVGYGKPPRHSQYPPGTSGNPKGRPRGARGLKAELKSELSERVTITENGKSKQVGKLRLVIKALAAKAVKGHVPAADKLLSLVIQVQGFDDEQLGQQPLTATEASILDRLGSLLSEIDAATDLAEDEPADPATDEEMPQ